LYYTASGIITPVGGRPVHRLRAAYSKNKFEKLVHLVGFIIRILHNSLTGETYELSP